MPGHNRRFVLLIDGRSGTGKSVLATELAERMHAQVLRLDDVYPGWSGLDRASLGLARILRSGRWRSWDWQLGAPGEWRRLAPGGRLIVEGVGAISCETRQLADTAIWLDLPDRERERRAIARDGDAFRNHWRMWAAQEARLLSREDPARLADARLAPASTARQADLVERLVRDTLH